MRLSILEGLITRSVMTTVHLVHSYKIVVSPEKNIRAITYPQRARTQRDGDTSMFFVRTLMNRLSPNAWELYRLSLSESNYAPTFPL